MDLRETQKNDPLQRSVAKNLETLEFSPMDPPDSYEPLKKEELVAYQDMHPFLQKLNDEHIKFKKELDQFEEALLSVQEKGPRKESFHQFKEFFQFFDSEFLKHHQKEEKILFPLLHKKLLENGEHSHNEAPMTPVDMMEEDHIKILQTASVCFNLLGMAPRLPQEKSSIVVLDTALEQGKSLIETVRLHIFREDNIILPLSHKHVSSNDIEASLKLYKKFSI